MLRSKVWRFFWKKLILLFLKDALNWSKVTVKTFKIWPVFSAVRELETTIYGTKINPALLNLKKMSISNPKIWFKRKICSLKESKISVCTSHKATVHKQPRSSALYSNILEYFGGKRFSSVHDCYLCPTYSIPKVVVKFGDHWLEWVIVETDQYNLCQ